MDRVTVQEAAQRLGISQDAVRQRIRRGSLKHEKAADGRVYVYMVPTDTRKDTHRPHVHQDLRDTVHDASTDVLVEELRDRVRFLEGQLDEERTANRENRRLLAAALERIPEIPSPEESSELREPPEKAPEEPSGSMAAPGTREWFQGHEGESYGTPPQEAEDSLHRGARSWWRRFFGFE